jgi:hypothetical protein
MTDPSELAPELQDLVDQFLDLADALHQGWPRSRVSHALCYAAARYAADQLLQRHADQHDSDDDAAAASATQYREMFIHNIVDLRQRYQEEGGFSTDW